MFPKWWNKEPWIMAKQRFTTEVMIQFLVH